MFNTTTIEADALDEDYNDPIVMESSEYEQLRKQASASEESISEWEEKLGDFSELNEENNTLRQEKQSLAQEVEELKEYKEQTEEIADIKEAMAEELAEAQDLFTAEELAEMEFSRLRDKFDASGASMSPAPRGGDVDDDEFSEEEVEELSQEEEERVAALKRTIEFAEGRSGWEKQAETAREEMNDILPNEE